MLARAAAAGAPGRLVAAGPRRLRRHRGGRRGRQARRVRRRDAARRPRRRLDLGAGARQGAPAGRRRHRALGARRAGRRRVRRRRRRRRGDGGRGRRRGAGHRYDATRSLGHVSFAAGTSTALDVDPADAAAAWHLAQALLAAESLGTVETCLDLAVAYAKERFTFGRAIGSYQAVKHALVEVLRLLENGRSLLYYAGLGRRVQARRVRAGRQRGPFGRRAGARCGDAHEHLRARRHRRDVGARRAAVLPPRAAVAAAAGRDRRGVRPGRRGGDGVTRLR